MAPVVEVEVGFLSVDNIADNLGVDDVGEAAIGVLGRPVVNFEVDLYRFRGVAVEPLGDTLDDTLEPDAFREEGCTRRCGRISRLREDNVSRTNGVITVKDDQSIFEVANANVENADAEVE